MDGFQQPSAEVAETGCQFEVGGEGETNFEIELNGGLAGKKSAFTSFFKMPPGGPRWE